MKKSWSSNSLLRGHWDIFIPPKSPLTFQSTYPARYSLKKIASLINSENVYWAYPTFLAHVMTGLRHCGWVAGSSITPCNIRQVWGEANWRMPSTQPLGIGDFVESGINSGPEGQAGVSKGLRTGQGWGGTELTRGGSLCVKVPEEPGSVAWDLMGDMMVGAGRQAVTDPGSYRPGGRDSKLQRGTKPDMVTNFRQDLGVTYPSRNKGGEKWLIPETIESPGL